jgi:hypothetical protein
VIIEQQEAENYLVLQDMLIIVMLSEFYKLLAVVTARNIIREGESPERFRMIDQVHIRQKKSRLTYLRRSNLSWSASLRRPNGSQKPRGAWAPSASENCIFKEDEVDLVAGAMKAEAMELN